MEDSTNVINFSCVTASRKYNKICNHTKLTFDDRNKTIECSICGAFLDPFHAFTIIFDTIEHTYEIIKKRKAEIIEAHGKALSLISAQKVEKVWRSKTNVPACPHCHNGIHQEDGLGSITLNKKHDLERRQFNISAQKNKLNPAPQK